jgi:hypothetical protein
MFAMEDQGFENIPLRAERRASGYRGAMPG